MSIKLEFYFQRKILSNKESRLVQECKSVVEESARLV